MNIADHPTLSLVAEKLSRYHSTSRVYNYAEVILAHANEAISNLPFDEIDAADRDLDRLTYEQLDKLCRDPISPHPISDSTRSVISLIFLMRAR